MFCVLGVLADFSMKTILCLKMGSVAVARFLAVHSLRLSLLSFMVPSALRGCLTRP